ncbi:MAG TPA: UDP-N-acetylglucosamine 2-epimerase (non-hydrolyzing) [Burkholderiales bacterium]|nr:UDP-N-acetylglucosamine 2-epimerase (non-hydrolyzing) [Burkholderiales bacterium]
MKLLTVLGARPQFIKACPVSRALAASGVDELIVHTGQHYEELMSGVFFEEMALPKPRHELGIGGLPQGAMTGRMLEALETVMLAERPDWVLVYGDTNSTLAGALAAAKLQVPLAHVEAGLRSFNVAMPEEINRRVTDHVSRLLFAPTAAAVANLRNEGITRGVEPVGDVMYDAALQFGEVARRHSRIIERLGVRPGAYVLATVHRAENTDDPRRLEVILTGLAEVAKEMSVVVPLHPRTRKVLEQGHVACPASLRVIEPVGYLDMLMLEQHAALIATDSGGVQKEAYFYGIPCVTLRDETEWVELVECGANTLAPPSSRDAVFAALRRGLERGRLSQDRPLLYGDGRASQRIAELLSQAAGATAVRKTA